MSEGDVSLIQDEDVLRKMWQQTEDMGKRKEIRAHMYKLREERLKNLYAESTQSDTKGLQFTSAGGHTDSFADQCFQSLKSKEIRDSESPTRDYNYKVQDIDNSNSGWNVVSKNDVSDDGKTHTQMTSAETSGTYDIDGGNASFAALKESQKSVTKHEDDNSKFHSTENASKTVAKEQFVSNTDDGVTTMSTTSSVGSSKTHSSYSQKFESNLDKDDVDFSSNINDIHSRRNVDLLESNNDTRKEKHMQTTSKNVVSSNQASSTVVKGSTIDFDEGELISRKIEHPDEFTKVVIETRQLPDGTTVTSTSRETKGSWSSKSGKQTKDHYDSATSTLSSTSERVASKQIKSHIDSENKVIMSDKFAEKKHYSQTDDNEPNYRPEICEVTNKENVESISANNINTHFINTEKTHYTNKIINDNTIVSDNTNEYIPAERPIDRSYEVNETDTKRDVRQSTDENVTESSRYVKKTSIENISDERKINTKDEINTKTYKVEEIGEVDKNVLNNQYPKPDADDLSNIIRNQKTVGEYVTTYQTDYTTKRISEDLSPTHNAWASSLRSSTDNSLHGGSSTRGSTRSLRTSMSSLRSSTSPEKKSNKDHTKKHNERDLSPKKVNSSPTRVSPKHETRKTVKNTDIITKDNDQFLDRKSSQHESIKDKTTETIVSRDEKVNIIKTTESIDEKTGHSSPITPSSPSKSPTRPKESSIPRSTQSPDRSRKVEVPSNDTNLCQSPKNPLRNNPSSSPTRQPSSKSPTRNYPSSSPTRQPSSKSPTRNYPSSSPTRQPSSKSPTRNYPSSSPTRQPSSKSPTRNYPSSSPTRQPSSKSPTRNYPSSSPTRQPSSKSPTRNYPSNSPTRQSPSISPSKMNASKSPTRQSPSKSPLRNHPSSSPTRQPLSKSPLRNQPSSSPTGHSPSKSPSQKYGSTSPTRQSPSKSPSRKYPSSSPTRDISSNVPISTTKNYPAKQSPSTSPTRCVESKTKRNLSPYGSPVRHTQKSPRMSPYSSASTSPTRSISPNKPMYESITHSNVKENIDSKERSKTIRRSRDSSPTTSVSEIEFISGSNNKSDVVKDSTTTTHSTFDTGTYKKVSNTTKKDQEINTEKDSTRVVRKSSLKKTSIKNNDTIIVSSVDNNITLNVESKEKKDKPDETYKISEKESKPKPKQHYVRSETYEERCRKILGMPDKKTLVEGAEKNLEILGILPSDKKPSKSEKIMSYHSPERELTTGIKSAELIRKPSDSEIPIHRNSSLKKSNDIQNQVENLVDAEYITLDNHGNVVSLEADKAISNKIDTYVSVNKVSENKKDTTSKFIEGEMKETLNQRSSPLKDTKGSQKQPKVEKNKNDSVDNSPEMKPCSPKKSVPKGSDVERSSSPRKDKEYDVKSPMKDVPDKVRTSSPNKFLPEKPTDVERKPSQKPDTKRSHSSEKIKPNLKRNSSPDKSPSRSASPQKSPVKKMPASSIVPNTTQISKTTKEYEKNISNKQINTNIKTDTKISHSKFSAETISSLRKHESSKSILSSQKYNIFKDDKSVQRNEDHIKKTPVTTSKHTSTPKGTIIQSTAQRKFDKDKLKSTVASYDDETQVNQNKKKHIDSPKKIIDQKHKDITTNKMHRSLTDTKSTRTSTISSDLKMTRTASDITMKTSKVEPTRVRSKPEIHLTKTTTKNAAYGVTTNKVTTTINKNIRPKTTTSSKSPVSTPKTSGIGNNMNENIRIDLRRATSSRESTPDHICPLPVHLNDDKEKPRLPDRVTEPDDYVKRKNVIHETISESDNIYENRIIELSDSENDVQKPRNFRVDGSDECLLTVTEKVTKFSNVDDSKESVMKSDIKKTHRKIITDEVEEKLKSDDCLLSVSDKVSKFTNVSDTKNRQQSNLISNDFIKHEIHKNLENDECLLSVNDKVSRFLSTAEKVTEPIKLSQPASKSNRPDLTMVGHEIKTDQSVSDKVNRYITTTEKITTPEKSPGLVSKASKMISDVKNKFEQFDNTATDIKLTVQKETIASQAKKLSTDNKYVNIKSQTTPDRNLPKSASITPDRTVTKTMSVTPDRSIPKTTSITPERSLPKAVSTPEKTPQIKPASILRSTDTVKKAKALFENIANQTTDSQFTDTPYRKTTKLTDIGVYKKSPTVESVPDVVPKRDVEDYSLCTESSDEIEKTVLKKEQKKAIDDSYNKIYKLDKHSTTTDVKDTTYKTTKHTVKTQSNEVTEKHSIDKSNQLKSTTVKKINVTQPVDTPEECESPTEEYVSTRRGSGKFGVELRRTSVDQAFTSERKRSSIVELHSQTTIEDIHDLNILEQMLEKVTGYEQRRRIRTQIRVVKKNIENKQMFSTTVKNDELRNVSPTRKNKQSTVTVEKHLSSSSPKKIERSISPAKKSKTTSPERKRSVSPTKKTQAVDCNKTYTEKRVNEKDYQIVENNDISEKDQSSSPARSKTSKVSEYTTAYLRKISASNNLKSEYLPKVPTIKKEKDEKTSAEYHTTYSKKVSTTTDKTSSMSKRSDSESTHTRSPSPRHLQSPAERIYVRTPSPDLKKPRQQDPNAKTELHNAFTNFKTKLSTKDLFNKASKQKQPDEKPEWVTTNVLRKTSTSEVKTSNKKFEDKNKTIKRSQSPSKTTRKPTDVITSSYGVGPMDENGKPLFGIKALRKPSTASSTYEVKGTVITKEFHSENGGEPEGHITVTAYSTDPTDLKTILDSSEICDSKISSDVKKTIQEKHGSRKGVSSITTTTRYGTTTGNPMSKIHKSNQSRAIEAVPVRDQPATVRRGSVKCLTEKFIKNAVETSKTEKSSYPKAGLILRTSSFKDTGSGSISSRSSTPGVIRSESNNSMNSTEMCTMAVERHEQHSSSHTSFLDNNTKVTGVQDIMTRMKNADFVIEDGDTADDAEARALLNKFLGATALMHGMSGYMDDKSHVKEYKQESRTVVTKKSTIPSDIEDIWDERILRQLLEESDDYEERRRIRGRLRQVMAEQEACAQIVADAVEECTTESVELEHRDDEKISTVETTTTTQKITNVSSKVSEDVVKAPKPVSPFAKFRQLDRQNSTNSSPSSPKTPLTPTGGGSPLFKFTDPQLQTSASNIKERLLQWCRDKTQEYENVKLDNFSTSWSDGLAFCALIHHFLPEEFDYSKLVAQQRRHNFTLAFKVADEKAGIYPLLDVEDMVTMRKPDWKCVFTYVQAIHRRFKDQD